jgi:endonuclease/exonuclease/phosphatase family metal-dependent hydrolase
LTTHFRDAQLLAGTKPQPTFPSRYPFLRIDHIFVSKELHVASVAITADRLTRRASDHLPLLVKLDLGRHVSDAASIGNVASVER